MANSTQGVDYSTLSELVSDAPVLIASNSSIDEGEENNVNSVILENDTASSYEYNYIPNVSDLTTSKQQVESTRGIGENLSQYVEIWEPTYEIVDGPDVIRAKTMQAGIDPGIWILLAMFMIVALIVFGVVYIRKKRAGQGTSQALDEPPQIIYTPGGSSGKNVYDTTLPKPDILYPDEYLEQTTTQKADPTHKISQTSVSISTDQILDINQPIDITVGEMHHYDESLSQTSTSSFRDFEHTGLQDPTNFMLGDNARTGDSYHGTNASCKNSIKKKQLH